MKSILLAMTTVLFFALNTQAQRSVMTQPRPVEKRSEWRPHIGLLVGAAQPEGSGDTASEFGVDVGYQPYIPFGLAAEYSHTRTDNGIETADRDSVLIKGTYHFGGDITLIKDSYVGVAAGAVFKPNGTSAMGAPLVGFDIPLTDSTAKFVSLGATARYNIVSDDEVDTFSLAGVVKYWY